jgi:hypothetical protein
MEKKQLQQWLSEIDKAIEEEKQMRTAPFWPGSNFSDSGSSSSRYDQLYSGSEKTASKLEQKRQEKLEEELDSLRSPQISKKSQQIIVKNKREGKVEDRLMQEALKRKQEASEREAKLKMDAKQKSMPVITPLAAGLKRDGDVVERLWDYQKVYQEKKETLKKEIEPEAVKAVPKINKTNVESRYMKPVKSSVQAEEFSYKPEISERSAKLAAKLGESKDRLLQKPAPKVVEDSECTFTPNIIKKDSENKIWWENLYQQSRIIQEKRDKQKETMDKMKEDPECTFKPKISNTGERKENPDERIKKLQDWQKSREERMKQFREQNSNKDLEGCTFAPKINKNIIPAQQNKPVSTPNKFLQRQQMNKLRSPTEASRHIEIEMDMDDQEYFQAMKSIQDEINALVLE